MLFHTWPFLVFMLVVLPVFFALRKTQLWIPWLMVASYFFYGWWNPYYLLLVVYSTALDYFLVALMDHCPIEGENVDVRARLTKFHFGDSVLKAAFIVSAVTTITDRSGCCGSANASSTHGSPWFNFPTDGAWVAPQQPENLASDQPR